MKVYLIILFLGLPMGEGWTSRYVELKSAAACQAIRDNIVSQLGANLGGGVVMFCSPRLMGKVRR